MSLQGPFAMMDAAGHVILRGWCGSSYTPGSPARNGTFFGKESHPWNQQRVGHEFGGPSNIEPGKVLMWFEVEDTGCGKLFFCRINLPLSRTLSLCIVDSLILCHLGSLHLCLRNNVPGHSRTICSTWGCQQLIVLKRLIADGLTTHAPSLFNLSKMYSR